jgi:hypothetical protein
MTAINGGIHTANVANKKENTQTITPEIKTEKAVEISSDQLNVGVKTGIIPTLKGAGVGLGATLAVGTAASLAYKASGKMGEWGGIFVVGGVLGGAAAGLISGGIAANTTDNKLKGALIGAATSGVIGGVALGITGKNPTAVMIGVVLGGVSGAIGGFGGAMVAQKK